jgi:hypothetical protein
VRRDVQALRLQAPGFALHLSPARLHIAKSGQFICYKTGQVYLLLTADSIPFMKKSAINTLLMHGGEAPVMFAGLVNTPADSRWQAAGPCGHRRIAHADIPRHANHRGVLKSLPASSARTSRNTASW